MEAYFHEKGVNYLNDSWIIENLNNALVTWNNKLAEIWSLVSQSPEEFKGGAIWGVVVDIHSALQGVAYGLLILFFSNIVVKCRKYANICCKFL